MRPSMLFSSRRAGRRIDSALSRGGVDVAAFPVALLGLILSASMSSCGDVKADFRLGQGAQKMTPLRADNAIEIHVAEASRRFRIPAAWIWAVMRVESAGDARALSKKGAMGLMQIMPATWILLRDRLGLGVDPFDPRDNILAGAAYLRDLHDRYGTRGFLAAYNAGPGRYEDHLAGRQSLPAETVDYVSTVGRRIDSGATIDAEAYADENIAALRSTLFPRSIFAQSDDQSTDGKRSTTRSPADQSRDEERSTTRSSADRLGDKKLFTVRSPAIQSTDEERSTAPLATGKLMDEQLSTVRSPADRFRDEKRSFGGTSTNPATREDRALARVSSDRVAVDLSGISPSSTGLFTRVTSR